MLEHIEKIAKRKDFKPFVDKSAMQIVKPLRGNVRKIAEILAKSEGISFNQRIDYAKMAGMTLKEGKNEIPIEYTESKSLEEVALLLFDLERGDIKDFDNMDEGEVNAGLALFFMKRKGM